MPQLDKYIFFDHIISLSIFFFLLYYFNIISSLPKFSKLYLYQINKLKIIRWNYSKLKKIQLFQIKIYNNFITNFFISGLNFFIFSIFRVKEIIILIKLGIILNNLIKSLNLKNDILLFFKFKYNKEECNH